MAAALDVIVVVVAYRGSCIFQKKMHIYLII